MSKLAMRKSRALFETENAVYERRRQRQIIIELKPEYMILRIKGTRQSYVLSYTTALNTSIRNEQARRKMEQVKKKATGCSR